MRRGAGSVLTGRAQLAPSGTGLVVWSEGLGVGQFRACVSTSGATASAFTVRLNYLAFGVTAPSAINIPDFRFAAPTLPLVSSASSLCVNATYPAMANAPTAALVSARYQVRVRRRAVWLGPSCRCNRLGLAGSLDLAQHLQRSAGRVGRGCHQQLVRPAPRRAVRVPHRRLLRSITICARETVSGTQSYIPSQFAVITAAFPISPSAPPAARADRAAERGSPRPPRGRALAPGRGPQRRIARAGTECRDVATADGWYRINPQGVPFLAYCRRLLNVWWTLVAQEVRRASSSPSYRSVLTAALARRVAQRQLRPRQLGLRQRRAALAGHARRRRG